VLGALGALLAAWGGGAAAENKETPRMEFPQKVLTNGAMRMAVYLPDAQKGFYRGARFDWSGQVAWAEFDGRRVFGPFREKYDAFNHDNCSGPAEEFDLEGPPPGYAEAKPGETFVKIGVGAIEKVEEKKYGFWKRYKIVDGGKWTVTSGKDWVEFRHELAGPRGWGYAYTKRVGLAPGKAAFTIDHALRNTGTKAIETTHYCHNFITIDGDPVGPLYRITFPFPLRATAFRGTAELKGGDLVVAEELRGDLRAMVLEGTAEWKGGNPLIAEALKVDSLWIAFDGGTGKVEDNRVTITDRRTGTGVRISGDRPPAAWRFYAERTAACPEPFLRVRAAPGEEMTWRSTYEFFVEPAAPAP